MKERNIMTECYYCINHQNIPGNTHIACTDPDPNMTGDNHGIINGWFFYPILFDPTWKTKLCNNFKNHQS